MRPQSMTEPELTQVLDRIKILERFDRPSDVRVSGTPHAQWYMDSMELVRSLIAQIRQQRQDLESGFMRGAYARLSELQYKERQLDEIQRPTETRHSMPHTEVRANHITDEPMEHRRSATDAPGNSAADTPHTRIAGLKTTALGQQISALHDTIAKLQRDVKAGHVVKETLQQRLHQRDIDNTMQKDQLQQLDALVKFQATKLENALSAVDTTLAVKADQDRELTRLREQVRYLQTTGTQQVEDIRELKCRNEKLHRLVLMLDPARTADAQLLEPLDRRLAAFGVKRRAQSQQDGNATDLRDSLDRECWQHAACLTIAEGTDGWDKPTANDSPAMTAVRELQTRLRNKTRDCETATSLADTRGHVIYDLTTKWAARRTHYRHQLDESTQTIARLNEELAQLKEWRDVVQPLLRREKPAHVPGSVPTYFIRP